MFEQKVPMYDPIKMFQIDKRPIGPTKYVSTIQVLAAIIFRSSDFGRLSSGQLNIIREGSRENKKLGHCFFRVSRSPNNFHASQYAAGFDHSTSSRTTWVSAW